MAIRLSSLDVSPPSCRKRHQNLANITDQGWDVGTFFSYYTMCFACPVLYVGWKLVKRSKIVKPEEADLVRILLLEECLIHVSVGVLIISAQVWERPRIDAYEASLTEDGLGFWEEVRVMMGMKKKAPELME